MPKKKATVVRAMESIMDHKESHMKKVMVAKAKITEDRERIHKQKDLKRK